MTDLAGRILDAASARKEAMLAFVADLATLESPSDVPESQGPVLSLLTRALEEQDYRVRRVPGRATGAHLLARPKVRSRDRGLQLLLGHCDTVWAMGTLRDMPVVREANRLRGPGVFDMKGGLAQMVFALRILGDLGLEPPLTPVVVVNSDEEIGSPESGRLIRRVARRVARVFIPEPAMGLEGRIKTARKGVSRFTVRVQGKAAHAGLDPTGGASAILELAHVIRELHSLTDVGRGISINVGMVSGGTRANVIAAEAVGEVDVRVLSTTDAEEVEQSIRGLSPTVPGTRIEVTGAVLAPPLERTPRNRALWERARTAAEELGIRLEECVAGGGSDGNTTSSFAATLDGLGAVGDGAHAAHEFLFVDKLVERCALLARVLLLEP